MQNNSVLCKFLYEHPDDYESILSSSPYNLRINKEGDYAIFNYSQYGSDFSNKIVQEARGIIIDMKRLDVICWPFRKFSNYGIESCDEIDWSTAKVQEKVDGSIIKLWYDKKGKEWVISSNGTIRASSIVDFIGETLDNKVKACFKNQGLDYEKLNKDFTYIFEYVSPYNRIIIQYDNDEVYHLGTRSNLTGEEMDIDIGIKKPAQYDIHSVEDCLAAAEALNADSTNAYSIKSEGYVVVDAKWNRVKIKSLKYIEAHDSLSGLYTAGKLSKKKIVELILKGDDEEFLVCYPNQKKVIQKFKDAINKIDNDIQQKLDRAYFIWDTICDNYTKEKFIKRSEMTEQDIRTCKTRYAAVVKIEMSDFSWVYEVTKGKIMASDIINRQFQTRSNVFLDMVDEYI